MGVGRLGGSPSLRPAQRKVLGPPPGMVQVPLPPEPPPRPFRGSQAVSLLPVLTLVPFLPCFLEQGLLENKESV